MTRNTNRNYIKPIFRFVTLPMVIFLGRFWAIMTKQKSGRNQSASPNSVIGSILSLMVFGMSNMIAFLSSFMFFCLAIIFFVGFPFFALMITFCSSFIFCCFIICRTTIFTIRSMVTFSTLVFIKLQKRFVFFATGAYFCYDCFRHFRFSCKRLCLEPVAGYAPAIGLFYYTLKKRKSNENI